MGRISAVQKRTADGPCVGLINHPLPYFRIETWAAVLPNRSGWTPWLVERNADECHCHQCYANPRPQHPVYVLDPDIPDSTGLNISDLLQIVSGIDVEQLSSKTWMILVRE
jgi:hypothetical protein